VTSLTNGGPEMALFNDGIGAFSGAITGGGNQTLGFATRIAVNATLIADPSKLVLYQPSTAAGDTTRPDFLLDRLVNARFDFAPQAGVGTAAAPFSGTLDSYLRQMTSQQADAAGAANSLKQGQDIVVNTLQQRFADQSEVNIDQEMTKLLNLQMAYGANARVMTTVRDMLDQLMKM
jgi:flagellar hook-associated protein 1 FlgK